MAQGQHRAGGEGCRLTPAAFTHRFLGRGEEDLWAECSCIEPKPGEPPRKAQLRFTGLPDFRSEAHLLLLRDGRVVGRVESSLAEPHEACVADPVVRWGEPVVPVAEELVARAVDVARGLGVRHVELLLQERLPYCAELLEAAPRWGFRPTYVKHVFRLDDAPYAAFVASPERELPAGATFRPLGDPRSPAARALIEEVARESLQEEIFRQSGGPAEFLVQMETHCRRMDAWHPEDWEALVVAGRDAGLVLPSFTWAGSREATNLHVGLVPAFRGRGLGLALEERGLRTMARRGARCYVGSCDTRNAPMLALFRKMGCRRANVQHLFELASGGATDAATTRAG